MILLRIKKILIWVAAIVLLLVISVFVVVKYYEDEVVMYALDKAKEQFTTTFEVKNADLTFWETFPTVSIRFDDVYIEDTFEKHDTLLFAQKIYLGFSLFDLFKGNYSLKKVTVENANANLILDKSGKDNWHFWKADSLEDAELALRLNNITLTQARIHYSDFVSAVEFDLLNSHTEAEGDFNSDRFALTLDYKGVINRLNIGGQNYISGREMEIRSGLDADTKNNSYEIKNAEIETGDMTLLAQGSFGFGKTTTWNLKVKGDDLELGELLSALPENYKKQTDQYAPDGDIDLDISITGSGKPKFSVDFAVRDGKFQHKDSGSQFENIFCQAAFYYANEKSELKLRKFTSNLNEGYVEAAGSITDGKRTEADLSLTANVDLRSIKEFFALDTLEDCSGKIAFTSQFKGVLKKASDDSGNWDYSGIKTTGEATLTEGLLQLKNSNRKFENLQATVLFNNTDASIQNFSGIVNGSDFTVNGTVNNLIPFIINSEERLTVDASLKSQLIDFTNLVETQSSTTKNQEYLFELPHRVDFSLNCTVQQFNFRKFNATNVRGVARLGRGQLVIDPLSFNTAEGSFMAQLKLQEATADRYAFNCLATLKDINIQTLFSQFENFNQEFIQDKNLRGKADATVTFKSELTKSLQVLDDKIESIVDIAINDGELIGVESLQDIARYVGENKWIAPFVNESAFAEKLQTVKFSRLENIIEIKNRQINIPLMDIRSSAMNILAKGNHGFDHTIDYTIGFTLRDILIRKEQEWQEADDGAGKKLYLYMRGTTENPDFGVDKQMAKETRQEEIQQEKQNMKALLKEEFGLFKKDQSVGTYKERVVAKETTTTLKWEENDEKEAVEKETVVKKRDPEKMITKEPEAPKKKTRKWLQEKDK